jgi:DNA-binding response OmpR family regulator
MMEPPKSPDTGLQRDCLGRTVRAVVPIRSNPMARILLIDDDDLVRRALSQTMAREGHTVIEATNGKEGLELFRSARADLVITDIVMPGKEGTEVLIELRKKNPPVKVIAISGGGRQSPADYLKVARHLGAAKVLAKPFSGDELLSAISELLPGGAGDAALLNQVIGGPEGSTTSTPARRQE